MPLCDTVRPRSFRRGVLAIALATTVSCTVPHAKLLAQVEEKVPTIDLSFPGGTLTEYIDAIQTSARQAAGAPPVNIIVNDPKLAQVVRLPAISFNDVPVEAAVEILQTVAAGDGIAVRTRTLKGRASQGSPIFLVQLDRRTPMPGEPDVFDAPEREELLEVRSVRRLVEGAEAGEAKLEAVLAAVETALSLAGKGAEAATLRYHPETGLLFLKGTPREVEIVDQVLETLHIDREFEEERAGLLEKQEKYRAAEAELGKVHEQLQAQRNNYESERARLQAKYEAQAAVLKEFEQRVGQELEELRRSNRELREQFEAEMQRSAALSAELEKLRSSN